MKNSSSTTSFLSKVLVGGISVFLADFLLTGVQISSILSGIILVVVIILINFTIKPILVLLTLPISLLTFGLFLLVFNAVVVLLAAELTPGFSVDGFWWALAFALILSVINSMLGVSFDSTS
jgi:putative membrane protein